MTKNYENPRNMPEFYRTHLIANGILGPVFVYSIGMGFNPTCGIISGLWMIGDTIYAKRKFDKLNAKENKLEETLSS